MEEWFDLRLPLPKTDLIGIPDFSMGAMENFGLVTFRDILMIYNDQTSHLIKMRSASVIYHELGMLF
jgi:aminopeptidase N